MTQREFARAERACPGDPSPLYLLGQFQSQRTVTIDFVGQATPLRERVRRTFATFGRLRGAVPGLTRGLGRRGATRGCGGRTTSGASRRSRPATASSGRWRSTGARRSSPRSDDRGRRGAGAGGARPRRGGGGRGPARARGRSLVGAPPGRPGRLSRGGAQVRRGGRGERRLPLPPVAPLPRRRPLPGLGGPERRHLRQRRGRPAFPRRRPAPAADLRAQPTAGARRRGRGRVVHSALPRRLRPHRRLQVVPRAGRGGAISCSRASLRRRSGACPSTSTTRSTRAAAGTRFRSGRQLSPRPGSSRRRSPTSGRGRRASKERHTSASPIPPWRCSRTTARTSGASPATARRRSRSSAAGAVGFSPPTARGRSTTYTAISQLRPSASPRPRSGRSARSTAPSSA